jgi:hypothetical protein
MEDFQKQADSIKKQSGMVELKKPDDTFNKMYKKFSKE